MKGRFVTSQPYVTSNELVELVQEAGYSTFNGALLRQWVHRGILPKGSAPTGVARQWTAYEAQWVLAACRLHRLHTRSDEMRIGLWLLGYPVPSGERLVQEHIEALLLEMREQITGVRDRPQDLSEQEWDAATERLQSIVRRSHVLDALVLGAWPAMGEAELAEIRAQHPALGAKTSRRGITDTVYPERTGLARLLPTSTGAAQKAWVDARSIPPYIEMPEYRYPRTDIPTAQQRTFRVQQAEEMVRGMLGFWPVKEYDGPRQGLDFPLYDVQEQAFELDDLVEVVTRADAATLQQARNTVQIFIDHYLNDQALYAPIRGAPKIDLNALLAPYDGSINLFFAAPKLFPLIGYLMAAHTWYLQKQPMRLPENRPYLVSMIADRLARRQKSRPPDDDTWLLLLLSLYCPVDTDERQS